MTDQQNKILDHQLQSFFRYLSPVFQIPAAHKSFEWLIRRFLVHENNVEEILRCVLPYHDTRLFVKVAQVNGSRLCSKNPPFATLLRRFGPPECATR